MHRREYIAGAGALGGLALMPAWASAAAARPIGLQSFTVMALFEQDFEKTFEAVAKLGYREIETIGAFGRDPKYVKGVLDRYGLVTPSQHMVPGTLYDEFRNFVTRKVTGGSLAPTWMAQMSVERVKPVIQEAAARAHALGQKYLVWQIIWPEQMKDRAAVARFADAMNEAGRLCKAEGLTFNFHNHSDEFKTVDGIVPYDYIVEHTDPALVKLEMDTYWVTNAGRDPIDYLARHPGRYVQCHLKDRSKDGDFATVGHGTVDFPKLLGAMRKAGVGHYYVEYDRAADPMKSITESYAYLKPFFAR